MPNEKKKTEAGSSDKEEAPSPEFAAFEKLAKEVLKVPKTEIDRREAEYQKKKRSKSKQ